MRRFLHRSCWEIGAVLLIVAVALLSSHHYFAFYDSARTTECGGNLCCVVTMLHNYLEKHGDWPHDIADEASGRRLLSWRVPLLEFCGQEGRDLLAKFRLDQSWDNPANLQLLAEMPSCFGCPADPEHTHFPRHSNYVLVTDPRLIRLDESLEPLSDEIRSQVLIVETIKDLAPWTCPTSKPSTGNVASVDKVTVSSHHRRGAYVVLERGRNYLITKSR